MTISTDRLVPPQEAVRPLMRGILLLRELSDADGRMRPSDLVHATGLARSTVDRLLSTLERMGYLRLADREAVLAPRLMEIGNAYLAASRLPGLLGPLADQLADRLDESVSLAAPDGGEVRFVHQASRRRTMSLSFRIGDLAPAERLAAGVVLAVDWKPRDWADWRRRRAADAADAAFPAVPPGDGTAIASFSDRVDAANEQGWSLDDQLVEPGLIAMAMPVRDAGGRPVCAVSVVSHTSRHRPEDLPEAVLPSLRETIRAMERALGQAPSPAAPRGSTPPAAWSRASKRELGPEFVESLARGLAVLRAFTEGGEALPLSAVAEATGLARATARRALITLQHLGYITEDGGLFRPTPRVLGLGFSWLSGHALPDIAQPHLAELVARVHDSASMAVLDGEHVRYVARVQASRVMRAVITVGTRFPAYATSMGRVLLASLPPAERAARIQRADLQPITRDTITDPQRLAEVLERVAAEGCALVEGELEEGLRSIAVPVRDRGGHVVAAVNVGMHAGRSSVEETRERVLPHLRSAADAIEADLRVAGRFARIPMV